MKRRYSEPLFFAVCSLFSLAANFTHPVTPAIFKSLNLPDYMFGVALATMMTSYFIFSPFWGKISTYIGSRTTLLICMLGYGVGQVFFATARTQGAFIFARAFAGIFTGGCFTAMMTYIVNTTPEPTLRGKRLTISATIQSVCAAFGYFIGGMLGVISPKVAVFTQAATLALSGVLFYLLCEDDATQSFREANKREFVRTVNPLATLIASKNFINTTWFLLFAVCALQNLGYVAFDQSLNYYMRDQFSFPTSYNGMLKGAMGIISLIANSTICMYLLLRTNYKKNIAYVFVVATAFSFAMIVAPNIPLFLLASGVLFAVNSVSMPILQTLVSRRAEEKNSNLVMGVYNSTKSVGGIFGALFSGGLYTLNPILPFVFATISFAAAGLFSLFYNTRTAGEAL